MERQNQEKTTLNKLGYSFSQTELLVKVQEATRSTIDWADDDKKIADIFLSSPDLVNEVAKRLSDKSVDKQLLEDTLFDVALTTRDLVPALGGMTFEDACRDFARSVRVQYIG